MMLAATVEPRRLEVHSAMSDDFLCKSVSLFLQSAAPGGKSTLYGSKAAQSMVKTLEAKAQQTKATLDDIAR